MSDGVQKPIEAKLPPKLHWDVESEVNATPKECIDSL